MAGYKSTVLIDKLRCLTKRHETQDLIYVNAQLYIYCSNENCSNGHVIHRADGFVETCGITSLGGRLLPANFSQNPRKNAQKILYIVPI